MLNDRIYLSAPDVGPAERDALLRAFDSNWIAPVGPELDAFEAELCEYTNAEACVALASGTAAIHLALLDAGIGPGDEVVVQSFTFAATAFGVVHAGATPVFIDSERDTWAIDPELLEGFLAERETAGRLPKAVISVDLYGSCADYDRLEPICERFGVMLLSDAAEALGSRAGARSAGTFGRASILSFNGNKIMTTSGGGALLGSGETVAHVRYLATQARQPVLHYEHTDIGFNYRMSNLLAALGRAQLAGLEPKIERRKSIADYYAAQLPSLEWCSQSATTRPNHWLSVGLLPRSLDPHLICHELAAQNIEARPAWKPMHLQPVFADRAMVGGVVCEELFGRGICLPSGSTLTDSDLERVVDALRRARI
ncbi:MAG: aminotransferase class I/II-fold pyridoxal phosphate-dependent enzyme [Acidimicrobiales bacterium]|nr:aminotransferase class I/II-fold pyridoxal phosphate-dependent enzyme [Acidimicrobiales bacterium]